MASGSITCERVKIDRQGYTAFGRYFGPVSTRDRHNLATAPVFLCEDKDAGVSEYVRAFDAGDARRRFAQTLTRQSPQASLWQRSTPTLVSLRRRYATWPHFVESLDEYADIVIPDTVSVVYVSTASIPVPPPRPQSAASLKREEAHVGKMVDALLRGDDVPPVLLNADGTIHDGRARVIAALRTGMPYVPAVYIGPFRTHPRAENPLRIPRKDFRVLQRQSAQACGAIRRVKLETAEDVKTVRRHAKEVREQVRQATREEVEQARAKRDHARARQAGACDIARRDVIEARGEKQPRVTPSERARERIQKRDAEIESMFGSIPGALELYRKRGGGITFGGKTGVERFAQVLHETPNVVDYVNNDFDEREFEAEQDAWYAKQARHANPAARASRFPPAALALLRRILAEHDFALWAGEPDERHPALDAAALKYLIKHRLVGLVDGYAVLNEDKYSVATKIARGALTKI